MGLNGILCGPILKKDRLRISGPTECHSDVIGGYSRFVI